ncbi:serine/threonine-protein kinase [Phycisphaeraceae bacterium D3-23]
MAEFHQIAGYDVVATLGQGAASTLYAVRDKKGDVYCLKRVVKNSPSEQRFLDQAICEYEVAQQVDSPLLRKVHRLIKHRALIRTNEVLVLLEMVEGKTIEHIKLASILSFCRLFHAAATGIKVMHDAGIVHADIKPSNIMITSEGKVKIIDFGQSCKVNTIKRRIQGTPDYIAPEQVLRRPITYRTDSFNLGATMYWKLTGRHVPTLIPKKDTAVSLRTESQGEFLPPIEIDPEVPPALSNLVMECVQTEPKQRPGSMDAIIDRLGIAASQAQRASSVSASSSDASEQRNAS